MSDKFQCDVDNYIDISTCHKHRTGVYVSLILCYLGDQSVAVIVQDQDCFHYVQ